VRGREELSRPFEFELLLTRHGEPLGLDVLEEIVRQPAVIAFGQSERDLVHGIITSIEHLDGTRYKGAVYVAKLVPQTSLLDFGKRSAVYQETTVADMVKGLLKEHGLGSSDYAFMVANDAKSPVHEYIVQYQESDWAFISRWLEHEGFFYWFEHSSKGAKLMIADENGDASRIADPSNISFREKNNLATRSEHTIWDFTLAQQRVPGRVTLVDYNHRRPTELMLSTEKVDPGGFGHVFHYGDHYKDKGVGDARAKIRAQELAVGRRVVTGMSDCTRFRVGHVFELENHHVGEYDGDYLITSIEHRAGFEVPSQRRARLAADQEEVASPYMARFTAIPIAVPYRPKRTTPWPRIYGVINGHIEADSSGDYAQIDAEGRYKVKMPYDVGSQKGLSSSRWVRMAQAYAGAGYGQHFPLHKGTEVLVTHIDGDPDRPLIIGSVPNTVTPGPVADANATQSVTQTASGMRIEFEDLQK
jgi:type VI secretion system secreted protein VgrG